MELSPHIHSLDQPLHVASQTQVTVNGWKWKSSKCVFIQYH